MTQIETDTITDDEILYRASVVARLIRIGDRDLRKQAAEYGRLVYEQQAIPEAVRLGFNSALAQHAVSTCYSFLLRDIGPEDNTRVALARNAIAHGVYSRS